MEEEGTEFVQRQLCKTLLELDRCFAAEATGYDYTTYLTKVVPASACPKNEVIVGLPKRMRMTLDSALGQAWGMACLQT